MPLLRLHALKRFSLTGLYTFEVALSCQCNGTTAYLVVRHLNLGRL